MLWPKPMKTPYHEYKDKWLFTRRGKDRSADNLLNARKAIDAPPPKEEKPSERFEAWYSSYGGIQLCTVTSMTESGSFWISYPGRHGRKERTQAGEYDGCAKILEEPRVIDNLGFARGSTNEQWPCRRKLPFHSRWDDQERRQRFHLAGALSLQTRPPPSL